MIITKYLLCWVGVFVAFTSFEAAFLDFGHEPYRLVYYLCSGVASAALAEYVTEGDN